MSESFSVGIGELSEDDMSIARFRKQVSRKRRKDREAAGEIHELNLTAMMDMLTILLVFLLKSYSSSSVSVTASEDIKPPSSTTRLTPKDTVAVTITNRSILVGDREVVLLAAGRVPDSDLRGRLIAPLQERLKKEVDKLKYIADRNPTAPFTHELSVVGDKKVPYDLLLSVLYTAGQTELENYRFIVIQGDKISSVH